MISEAGAGYPLSKVAWNRPTGAGQSVNPRGRAALLRVLLGQGSKGMTLGACLSELCHFHPFLLGGQDQHLISIFQASALCGP